MRGKAGLAYAHSTCITPLTERSGDQKHPKLNVTMAVKIMFTMSRLQHHILL